MTVWGNGGKMLAETLIRLRNFHHMSQDEVSEKVGVSRQAYGKWEKGETLPDVAKAKALADIFNTTIDNLYSQDQSVNQTPILPGPPGKHIFGTVSVNDKGQILIPKKAREVMGINSGDSLVLLGDEESGLALIKAEEFERTLQSIMLKAAQKN